MTGSVCYKYKVTKPFWQVNYRWSNSKETEGRGKEMDEKVKLGKERLIIKVWNFSLINLNCIYRFEVFI